MNTYCLPVDVDDDATVSFGVDGKSCLNAIPIATPSNRAKLADGTTTDRNPFISSLSERRDKSFHTTVEQSGQ